jgi:hypothetical protein
MLKLILKSHLFVLMLAVATLLSQRGEAYPEFQKYVQENSGRFVNCSLCHTHAEGPEGDKLGQIGRLDQEALERLNEARMAAEANNKAKSPILNKFGNHILNSGGMNAVANARGNPAALYTFLPKDSDLDGDGVTDVKELAAGTNPSDESHGPPLALFIANFKKNFGLILALTLSFAALFFGIGAIQRSVSKEE